MSDWEARMSERARVKQRQARAEELAALPPIRLGQIPLGEFGFLTVICDGISTWQTVTLHGKTYRLLTEESA